MCVPALLDLGAGLRCCSVQKTEYSAPRALPVPLRLSNVTEIDVILGSGTARSTPICPNGVCPPTKTAR